MALRTISLVNFKGGVGKTSLAVNISACLAHNFGQRVLLVDCDLQSNSSIWILGIERWNFINLHSGQSLRGSFIPDGPPLKSRIMKDVLNLQTEKRLDLLPATYELHELEGFEMEKRFFTRFHEELQSIRDEYDYVIFDCPPNLFNASKTAVFASNEIYVPCNHDLLSAIGLNLLTNKLNAFYKLIQSAGIAESDTYRHARIRGIILNNINTTANTASSPIVGTLNLTLAGGGEAIEPGAQVLPQHIRTTVTLVDAMKQFRPVAIARGINQNTPAAKLREDYLNLTERIHKSPPRR